MGKMDERITVAERAAVFPDERLIFTGFLAPTDARSPVVMSGLCTGQSLRRRGDVEEDESLLQPIPYIALIRTTDDGVREVFTYERLSGSGEQRLHGKLSCGIGGHLNANFDAASFFEVMREEGHREMAEELDFPEGAELPSLQWAGFLRADETPVDRVHIGLLFVAEVPAGTAVSVRETEQLRGGWRSVEALRADEDAYGRLETWSKFALDALRHHRRATSDEIPGYTVRIGRDAEGEGLMPIPDEVVERLGWEVGDRLRFRILEGGRISVQKIPEGEVLEEGEYEGRVVPTEEA